MVSIVIVSHSPKLADGVVELSRAMAGPGVRIVAAAGLNLPDTPLGTDAALISEIIQEVYSDEGVLVLMDIGSAILSSEMAVEMLPAEQQAKVILCSAPIVEGAVAAGVKAHLGHNLAEVALEAQAALAIKCAQLGEAAPEAPAQAPAPVPDATGLELSHVLKNHHGLHARPAASFLRTAARYQAEIQVRNLSTGKGPVRAAGIKDLMLLDLRHGHTLQVTAVGPDAQAALADITTTLQAIDTEAGELPADTPGAPAKTSDAPSAAPAGADLMLQAAIERGRSYERILKGLPVAPGIVTGPVRKLHSHMPVIPDTPAADPQDEWKRLKNAWVFTEQRIERQRARLASRNGQDVAAMFDAHLLLLEDDTLREAARQAIFNSGWNAARAWQAAVDEAAGAYSALENAYLRERTADVREVGAQVLKHLLDCPLAPGGLDEPGILLAEELDLNLVAEAGPHLLLGICTVAGAPTAHAAILARNLGIPTIMGLGEGLEGISDGSTVIVDGGDGTLLVEPCPELLDEYMQRARTQRAAIETARLTAAAPAETRDGRRLEIAANIGSVTEASAALASGAEAVGLFRTEFLFLGRPTAPDEEEQLQAYLKAAEALEGRPLVIRTLDIGGDKVMPYLNLKSEANPFLGLRGLRLCLNHRSLFKTQLRAVLRAAMEHPIRLMFPMVATLAEWRAALEVLAEARAELGACGCAPPARIETGIMLEVPAAALQAARFSTEVDFFSIGSNDLTQYTLAAERGNAEVAALGDGLQPPVLRLIRQVVEAAHANGKWVGLCGELAADPLALPLLVGLGLDELSMHAGGIPQAKAAIRALNYSSARQTACACLELEDAQAVREYLNQHPAI